MERFFANIVLKIGGVRMNRLRELREAKSLSRAKVATDLGISRQGYGYYESGKRTPSVKVLKKLAEYFDVGINYFLDESGASVASRRGVRVPIIGEIRAGSPIITEETLVGYDFAEVEDENDYFFLTVRGDSMKNIGMLEGSLVLFKKQQYAENGDVVACLVGGDSATVKRFFKDKRGVRLEPENEDYKPILLSPEDFETGEARILGVAREIKIKL
jgi:repressor LexA